MGCNDIFYFPKDNSEFFDGVDMNLVEWLRQRSEDEQTETFYVVS